jgi:hypothetical protein
MENLQQYIPFLIPVLLLQLALMTVALIDLIRRPATNGPKWLWVLVIILINMIGPIIYFLAGRREE